MKAIRASTGAVPSLFPPDGERRRHEEALDSALRNAMRRVSTGPVGPTFDLGQLRADLEGFDFAGPRPLDELLTWTIAQLETGIVHLTHPRYFGLFNPAPSFPAECAERIVGAFNPQLATAKTSPAAVAIEAHVISAVAARAGLPSNATGHFTTGGSEANFTALVCALTRANPHFATDGVRAFPGAPLVYVSADAHQAWQKIVHQTGLGRASLRLVATDALGQMDPASLRDMIATDRAAGRTPVMIAATAGTTGAGMIDPLGACADVAGRERIWFHVDAAWGGALLASERLSGLLDGIERADSITIDAHKWFATTMGCGMFLTRDPDVLSGAFHAATPYMPSNVRHVDPYVTTVQWSRRFLGLRLFLSLATVGWAGYGTHIEYAVDLIAQLRDELTSFGWTVENESPMAVLCVSPPSGFPDAATIAREVVASNAAWVASTVFRGQPVLRICVTNGRSTAADISALVQLLQSFGDLPIRSVQRQELIR